MSRECKSGPRTAFGRLLIGRLTVNPGPAGVVCVPAVRPLLLRATEMHGPPLAVVDVVLAVGCILYQIDSGVVT